MTSPPAPGAPFAGAVRALRSALGETQEGMARRLGISLSGYRYWESGQRTPRGRWLVRLRELCPGEGTRVLFGGTAGPPVGGVGRDEAQGPATGMKTPWDAYKNGATRAIEALCERAAGGDAAAQERLRSIFTELSEPLRPPAEAKRVGRSSRRR